MRVLLISTYDLGRQPFGLASPAAWLRRAGAEVRCLDLAVDRLDEGAVRDAELVAFYLPMHTATRLAVRALERVRALNPRAHLCGYGLYAPMNESFLRALGVHTILGGEFEAGLVSLLERLVGHSGGPTTARPAQREPLVSLDRQAFLTPDRAGLPALSRYARLECGDGHSRTVGYTEASRGCRHRCRHCPVVPVYQGRFRIVQRDVVLADIRQQVAAGAEHVTFGDPDFFNGIGHALPLIRAMHAEHPALTYDVTVKIEHLLRHAEHLPTLRKTGCLFVTSAVESIDDRVLTLLEKGHTRDDFLRVVRLCRGAGLTMNPTFVAFTPWNSLAGYHELLALLDELDLVDQVAPVQLAIRLLIPAGSRLLELPEVRDLVEPFDEVALVHPWRHPDPRVDRLQTELQRMVHREATHGHERREIFRRAWDLAERARGGEYRLRVFCADARAREWPDRAPVPYLTEPWYC